MLRFGFIVVLLLALLGAAGVCEQDVRNAQSWMGLTGLYVVPTARVLEKGSAAFTFSEPKHVEYVHGGRVSERYMDRQVGQALTYGVTDNLEIYVRRNRNLYDQGSKARLDNSTFWDCGLKWQICPEDTQRKKPAVALAVRGVGSGRDVSGIPNIRRGEMGFLLATKRMAKSPESKNYMDFTVGVGLNYQQEALLFGAELAVSPTLSIIAEGMSNSPFINFREYDANGNKAGRFVYNTGIRYHSDTVPGMIADLGFIGDGAFEFSFGWGYVTKF